MKIHNLKKHTCEGGCKHGCSHGHRHPLHEGTKYDKKAIAKLANSGLFDEETSAKIVNALFKEDIHAFVHSPAWLEKYLIGIVNMLIKHCDGDRSKAQGFLDVPNLNNFNEYLTYIKELRPTLPQEKQLELDKTFNEQMSYEDMVKELEEMHAKLDAESAEKLQNTEFTDDSDFELVPIDSYEQMNQMFGGAATGDGSSDKYAGGGGTAWCHTNSEPTYRRWVDGEKYKFFVLAHKNWKDIPFNAESNKTNPKDDYGNSLIAILVNARNGSLKYATLRCNHVGTTNADHQYKTYAELSEVAGFNVDAAVKNQLGVTAEHGEDEVQCYGCEEYFSEDELREGSDEELYCDDCWTDCFFTCDDCGDVSDLDYLFAIDGYYYCEYCAGRHGFACYRCGEGTSWDDGVESPDGDWYCEYCADRAEFSQCEDCGETRWNDDMIYVEDFGYVCIDCFNDGDYFECISCSCAYEGDYSNYTDDGPVCDDCIERGYYFYCTECNGVFIEDEKNLDDDGQPYCSDCYAELMDNEDDDDESNESLQSTNKSCDNNECGYDDLEDSEIDTFLDKYGIM